MLNLPTTSYRDIAIKDNDLVVGTYGRGFWVLDDYSLLRQITPAIASEPAHLFKPGDAVRIRRNVGADTPFPPEVPHALNPPDGAIIDYWLARRLRGDDHARRARLRRRARAPSVERADRAGDARPRVRRTRTSGSRRRTPLPANAGTQPHELGSALRRAARVHALVRDQRQPRAHAGVARRSARAAGRLHAQAHAPAARSYTQTVNVRNDPRSPATLAAIRAQHALQMKLVDGIKASYAGHAMATALQTALRGAVPAGATPEPSDPAARALALAAQLDTVAGLDVGRGRGGGRGGAAAPNFRALNAAFVAQLNAQDNGDMAPTTASLAAFAATCKELQTVVTAWERLRGAELTAVNQALTARGRAAVAVALEALRPPRCS